MASVAYSTYYSISGFSYDYRYYWNTDDENKVSFDANVALEVNAGDHSGLTYSIDEVDLADGTVRVSLETYGDVTDLILDGMLLIYNYYEVDASVVALDWTMNGASHTSIVMELDVILGENYTEEYEYGTRYYFVLGGDTLPEFSSLGEFVNFGDTDRYITGVYVATGAYGEGAEIEWSSLPTAEVIGADEDFTGTPGRDVFNGGYGNDAFFSSEGRDVYRGGVGDWDSVSYSDDPAGVTINLAKGFAIDGWGDRDALSSIEMARGSMFDDTMIGGNRTQTFRGLAGDDLINGGKGPDEARYDRDAKFGGEAGVTVNLQKGFAIDGFGDRDTLKSIENVKGSEQGDRIIGSNAANTLRGEGGNDSLLGLGGNDTLVGGNGRDRLDGGAGNDMLTGGGAADRFIFSGDFGDDIITDFQTAGTAEKIDLSGVASIRNLADLRANHLVADGPNTVIDDHLGNTITLWGVSMDDLVKNDFLF
ncbi:MAG: calcium-binding protein [Pseudodonghicola sp.]